MSLRARRRCFRGLVKLCGEYGILPSSYIIPESKVEKLGDTPISSGGSSDVWPGVYYETEDTKDEDGGKYVAIKVIRYCNADDVQTVKKVRRFDLSPSRFSLTAYRTFAERS
jgi:hypothetical protein